MFSMFFLENLTFLNKSLFELDSTLDNHFIIPGL